MWASSGMPSQNPAQRSQTSEQCWQWALLPERIIWTHWSHDWAHSMQRSTPSVIPMVEQWSAQERHSGAQSVQASMHR
jgi:hypothetical protein